MELNSLVMPISQSKDDLCNRGEHRRPGEDFRCVDPVDYRDEGRFRSKAWENGRDYAFSAGNGTGTPRKRNVGAGCGGRATVGEMKRAVAWAMRNVNMARLKTLIDPKMMARVTGRRRTLCGEATVVPGRSYTRCHAIAWHGRPRPRGGITILAQD